MRFNYTAAVERVIPREYSLPAAQWGRDDPARFTGEEPEAQRHRTGLSRLDLENVLEAIVYMALQKKGRTMSLKLYGR